MPDGPTFHVWLEGLTDWGQKQPATYCGVWPGETFEAACAAWAALHDRKPPDQYYDPKTNTYWGSRFFDNEADARKRFG